MNFQELRTSAGVLILLIAVWLSYVPAVRKILSLCLPCSALGLSILNW